MKIKCLGPSTPRLLFWVSLVGPDDGGTTGVKEYEIAPAVRDRSSLILVGWMRYKDKDVVLYDSDGGDRYKGFPPCSNHCQGLCSNPL